jgi:hypothetical protein
LICDKEKSFGCKGGSVSRVFDYSKKNKLVDTTCVTYEADDSVEGECKDLFESCTKYELADYC